MELFGPVALWGLAHPPGQRQGRQRKTTWIISAVPMTYAAAIHNEHHRLPGEMTQQDLRIGQKVHLLQDMGVVEPPRKAFDPAVGFAAVGHLRGDVRQLGALAALRCR